MHNRTGHDDFEAFMRAEAAKWGPILKQADIRAE
jgi:hypothetical protein